MNLFVTVSRDSNGNKQVNVNQLDDSFQLPDGTQQSFKIVNGTPSEAVDGLLDLIAGQ